MHLQFNYSYSDRYFIGYFHVQQLLGKHAELCLSFGYFISDFPDLYIHFLYPPFRFFRFLLHCRGFV